MQARKRSSVSAKNRKRSSGALPNKPKKRASSLLKPQMGKKSSRGKWMKA